MILPDSREAALANLRAALDGLPDFVVELGRRFAAAGFELALVGGPVRDGLIGVAAPDIDLTTSALPDDTLAVIRGWADAHWEIGKEYGTIGLRKHGETLEITTYRADSYSADSRKPEVRFGDSLAADLARRDFTIGAMAVRLPGLELVDPLGGLDDLVARRLRTPGPAEVSFDDDPLRMMRAARFLARFDLAVADDVRAACVAMSGRLDKVSAERIRDELSKLMVAADPGRGLGFLTETGLADVVLPELPALRLERDDAHRHKDVYRHTLKVVEQAIGYEVADTADNRADPDLVVGPDLVLRLAALLHDIGKPATRRYAPGGQVTFYHHDVVGAKLARKRLRALRFDNDTTEKVALLVSLHLRFFGYDEAGWTDSAVRRYMVDAGAELGRLHALTRADVTTQNRRKADRLAFAYDDLIDRIKRLRGQEELDKVRPDLTGRDIMRILDLAPGPAVGRAYAFLMELRLDEGPLGEAAAEERLRAWWAEHGEDA